MGNDLCQAARTEQDVALVQQSEAHGKKMCPAFGLVDVTLAKASGTPEAMTSGKMVVQELPDIEAARLPATAQASEDAKTIQTSPMVDDAAVQEEDHPLVAEARTRWNEEQQTMERRMRLERWEADVESTRRVMQGDEKAFGEARPANRYGSEACLPVFYRGKHVPFLGLMNPMSGAMAGLDIMSICRATPYYRDRMFNIIDVVRGKHEGGLLDVFRIELNRVKDEAKAMNTRPRLISGGGDGTGSFALFMVFLTLQADKDREDMGLADTGNGFIWTDEEMAESFPALAQMPLGSANDFANILGWGQKYPGSRSLPCTSHVWCGKMLSKWFEAVINPGSRVVNFDIWGIMPRDGETSCDFKIAELAGPRGRCPNVKVDGHRQLHLKQASKPMPLFICLYFSAGFGAYMTARFQLNRHQTPVTNRLEYIRQGSGLIMERTPPQLGLRLEHVEIDCDGEPYFPPRRDRGNRGKAYREVGFYNVNWQAHALHGADRASCSVRLCGCGSGKREPVKFNDGHMDMFRWKFASLLKNPGLQVQTDKRRNMLLRFDGGRGKGVFFQWDGEARFAFSPTGKDFHMFVKQVLSIPVVLGPYHDPRLTGGVDNGRPVRFSFCGDTEAEREVVRQRILRNIRGELDEELSASRDDLRRIPFQMPDLPEVGAPVAPATPA